MHKLLFSSCLLFSILICTSATNGEEKINILFYKVKPKNWTQVQVLLDWNKQLKFQSPIFLGNVVVNESVLTLVLESKTKVFENACLAQGIQLKSRGLTLIKFITVRTNTLITSPPEVFNYDFEVEYPADYFKGVSRDTPSATIRGVMSRAREVSKEIKYLYYDYVRNDYIDVSKGLPGYYWWNTNGILKIIIHGFLQHRHSDWVVAIARAYASQRYAVVVVDWSMYVTWTSFYVGARDNSNPVGAAVGEWLSIHIDNGLIDPTKIHVVGFSLGAQVAGQIGSTVRRLSGHLISRVTGLDPAGPGFDETVSLEMRLDSGDASCVDIIHTDGGVLLTVSSEEFGWGIPYDAGHKDFYVNGGKFQPSCSSKKRSAKGCSHAKAAEYFVRSVLGQTYTGFHCNPFLKDVTQSNCRMDMTSKTLIMGEGTTCKCERNHLL